MCGGEHDSMLQWVCTAEMSQLRTLGRTESKETGSGSALGYSAQSPPFFPHHSFPPGSPLEVPQLTQILPPAGDQV